MITFKQLNIFHRPTIHKLDKIGPSPKICFEQYGYNQTRKLVKKEVGIDRNKNFYSGYKTNILGVLELNDKTI